MDADVLAQSLASAMMAVPPGKRFEAGKLFSEAQRFAAYAQYAGPETDKGKRWMEEANKSLGKYHQVSLESFYTERERADQFDRAATKQATSFHTLTASQQIYSSLMDSAASREQRLGAVRAAVTLETEARTAELIKSSDRLGETESANAKREPVLACARCKAIEAEAKSHFDAIYDERHRKLVEEIDAERTAYILSQIPVQRRGPGRPRKVQAA